MLTIALLTHTDMLPHFHDVVSAFSSKCTIDLHAYEKQYHLLDIVPSIADQYDGICVYGATGDWLLQQSKLRTDKPILALDKQCVDYYQALFHILDENRDLDFSRVLIDISRIRPDGFTALADLAQNTDLLDSGFPFGPNHTGIVDSPHFEDTMCQNALRYWQEGGFDTMVCRHSQLAQAMRTENIPCILLLPDRQRVEGALDHLITRISLDKLRDGLPASIVLIPSGEMQNEYREVSNDSIRIQKALLEFGKNYASNFSISFTASGYEVLTSYAAIQQITSQYTFCQMAYYLFSTLGLHFSIGYGVGKDISNARQNARSAQNSAYETGMSCIVIEDGSLIPLQARHPVMQSSMDETGSSMLSRKTGLSPTTLQRISSALQFLGTSEVTNSDLADALQVTVANANRFLNALLRSGYAEITETKKSAAKGRPSKVYKIQL
ncbi:MAG: hypothetical protein FWF83_02725 [Clostridiales bacterium]|nr:hypothetical protein [Clostridiales bacterium]